MSETLEPPSSDEPDPEDTKPQELDAVEQRRAQAKLYLRMAAFRQAALDRLPPIGKKKKE